MMNKKVLIVGGYGVVGMQLAALIRARHPDLELLLAGRSQHAANAAAAQIGNASGIVIDINESDPLSRLQQPVVAIIGAVNDAENVLLKEAITRAIPYLDITRWTDRLLGAHKLAMSSRLNAPVTLASSWMAGVSAILAKQLSVRHDDIISLDTQILFRLKDKAGPNSVEYADRLSTPFRIWQNRAWHRVWPMSDPLVSQFPSRETFKTYRFDEPSQETLVNATGVASISSRVGYDDVGTARMMAFLVKSGAWRLISGDKFTKFRRSLLYRPGQGASHEIFIEAKSKLGTHRVTLVAPQGQTHLTAIGAYIQLSETLGLDGQAARAPGVHFPEYVTNFDFALRVLESEGIEIRFLTTE